MKKTLKKVLAVVLAFTVIFTVPVIAFAEGEVEKFDYSLVEIVCTDGVWKDNYVNTLKITVKGAGKAVAGTGVILTAGTNEEADNMLQLTADAVSVSFNGENTILEFTLDKCLDHATEYNFCIKEGAFSSNDAKVNAEYKFSTTGNLIIETINVTPIDIPANPLEKLVRDMENSKYAGLLKYVIKLLKWFMSL